jgi:biopolymer transport protein ExbB/TolQ
MSQASQSSARGLPVSQVLTLALAAAATVAVYAALFRWASPDSLLYRYLAGHPVEYAEVALFLWAMTALGGKAFALVRQRYALRRPPLPVWDGQPVSPDHAAALLSHWQAAPGWVRHSLVGTRARAALEFVHLRQSAVGLDAHLRRQADSDAETIEGGYALVRFIIWAIPILGFLGTVLGITEAIGKVTPEQLAGSLSGVTSGLAIAFDTTAVALALSMVVMFASFAVERAEQGILAAVDDFAQRELVHRFHALDAVTTQAVAAVRLSMDKVVQQIERLVQRQAEIWAASLQTLQARWQQAERLAYDRLTAALAEALQQTLVSHEQRLDRAAQNWQQALRAGLEPLPAVASSLERTRDALLQQAQQVQQQADAWRQLQDNHQHLLQLQQTLAQNLHLLHQTESLQQAVHSLTAAIHLLTARTEPPTVRAAPRVHLPQGNAA